MKIIAGSTHHTLAKRIANLLSASLIIPDISNFADSEFRIQITENVKDDHVYIIQSTCTPINDNIIELLLLIDTVRRADANKITAIIPYFGYSRQDRVTYNYGPLAAQLMVDTIKGAGADEVLVVDIHSSTMDLAICNIDSASLLINTAPNLFNCSSSMLVGPDTGSTKRVQKLSIATGCDFIILDKVRNLSNSDCVIKGSTTIQDKNCILIDDIVSTGMTLYRAVQYLNKHQAASINVFITHMISSKSLDHIVENSTVQNIYITDTIMHDCLPYKLSVLSIDQLLASIIKQRKNEKCINCKDIYKFY